MATVKKMKKAENGIVSDSTSYYKKRAEDASNKLAKGDLRDIKSNFKDFSTKQGEYKAYTRRNKPGYDAQGKSKFEKLIGMKNGGKVKKAVGKAKKFAALAPPKDKVTFADKIAGAKKKKK